MGNNQCALVRQKSSGLKFLKRKCFDEKTFTYLLFKSTYLIVPLRGFYLKKLYPHISTRLEYFFNKQVENEVDTYRQSKEQDKYTHIL